MKKNIDWQTLHKAAREAMKHAYAPYSNFHVGAALLCEDGTIITGCNVENISYGLTNCAERVAIGRAVVEGHRRFQALVVTTLADKPTPPCGACRQVIVEFAANMPIRCHGKHGFIVTESNKLLPHAFTPTHMRTNPRGNSPRKTARKLKKNLDL